MEVGITRFHNKPPIAETLREACDDLAVRLPQEFAAIMKRTEELKAAFGRVPLVVTDANAGDVSDQIAQIADHSTLADALRKAAVDPVLKAQRAINTFFDKNCFDDLDQADKKRTPGAKQILGQRLTVYETKKADDERRAREEIERKAREAAAEAERLAAAELERVRQAEEAERKRAADALAAIQNEQDMARAIEMEALEKAAAAERAIRAQQAADAAERARAEAEKASHAANAKAAELHTVRGDLGSSSSLRTTWKARRTDKDVQVDLNALRDFISAEVVEKAANAFARIHKKSRPVAGLEFYEESSAVVRG